MNDAQSRIRDAILAIKQAAHVASLDNVPARVKELWDVWQFACQLDKVSPLDPAVATAEQVKQSLDHLAGAKGKIAAQKDTTFAEMAPDVAKILLEVATSLRNGASVEDAATVLETLVGIPELAQHVDQFVGESDRIHAIVAQLVKCPYCPGLNHPNVLRCEHCGRSLAVDQSVAPSATDAKTLRQAAEELKVSINTLKRWNGDFAKLLSTPTTDGPDVRTFTAGDMVVLARIKKLLVDGKSTDEVIAALYIPPFLLERDAPAVPAPTSAPEQNGNVCTHCHAPLKSGAKFCAECGYPLTIEIKVPAPIEYPVLPVAGPKALPPMTFLPTSTPAAPSAPPQAPAVKRRRV